MLAARKCILILMLYILTSCMVQLKLYWLSELSQFGASHRRRKGLKVGGAEVPVVAVEVDPRCTILCNSKVAQNNNIPKAPRKTSVM